MASITTALLHEERLQYNSPDFYKANDQTQTLLYQMFYTVINYDQPTRTQSFLL